MILGIGIDIISIDRIQRVQQAQPHRFAQRILTDSELNTYFSRKCSVNYLASRFAAKEAASKALTTGIGKVSFKDLETYYEAGRVPAMRFYCFAKKIQEEKRIKKIHLTLSHELTHAVACVVLERI